MKDTENHSSTLSESYAESIRSTNKEERTAEIKRPVLLLVMVGFQIAMFIASLDKTVVATSLPRIGSDFEAMSLSPWVINSFGLAYNAFQPLFTKLSDIFGRKSMIITGLVLFLIGSALAGAAMSMVMLIASRAIQGIGAASIISMIFVIISDLVPLDKRSIYQGYMAIIFTLASVTGPLIGGAFTDHLSWRWEFYINLPLGVVSMAILVFTLRLPMEKQYFKEQIMRIDFTGIFLILTATTLFLLAMNFGGQEYPWKSATVIALIVASGVLLALFTVVEVKYAKEPLMPPRLFKNRTVVAILFVNLFYGMLFFPMIYNLPTYFQSVRGDSATWSGIRVIPMEAAVGSFAAFSGFIISHYAVYRPLLVFGIALSTATIGLFSLFNVDTNWTVIYIILFCNGIGAGTFLAANSIAIQAAVEQDDIAVAIGLREFVNALGGSLGVAIASSVLNSTLKKKLPKVIPLELVELLLKAPEAINNGMLPPQYYDATIATYVDSLKIIWYILTVFAGIAFICTLFIKSYPLRRDAPDATEIKEENKQQG